MVGKKTTSKNVRRKSAPVKKFKYTVTMEPHVYETLRTFGEGILATGVAGVAAIAADRVAAGKPLVPAWRPKVTMQPARAGRPVIGRERRAKHQVSLHESIAMQLREMGDGNLSHGIVLAAAAAGLIRARGE